MRLRSGRLWIDEAGPPAARWQFRVSLDPVQPGQVRVRADFDGRPAGAEQIVRLNAGLAESLRQFMLDTAPGDAAQRDRDLVELGYELGKAVFAGPVADSLSRAMDEARAAGQPLHLLFESAEPALLSLPFEAARLPDGRAPALQPGVHVARQLAGAVAHGVEPLAGPLRILAAVAAPDEDQTASVPLDRERELQTLLDVVDRAGGDGRAQVTILEVAHPDQVRQALLAQSYHVLHISGHGTAGLIEMEDEDGRAVPVSPAGLADAIRASGRSLPLVFLSSCLSGLDAAGTAGFAQGLLAGGIPQVVAMQRSVSDWYATRLAGAFYRHLGAMQAPLAGHALALARQEVETERQQLISRGERGPGLQAEYATPALFQRLAGDERPLLDGGLPPQPLRAVPPFATTAQMPILKEGDLIGRRRELRRITRTLLDDPRTVAGQGSKAGVLVQGIGGVGKSALAGRVMARLHTQGWIAAVALGRWGLGELAATVGAQLLGQTNPELQRAAALLLQTTLPDEARLQVLGQLLAGQRLLLVLDNYEDNLALLGREFLDPASEAILLALLGSARQGKVLITSRYPLPAGGEWLASEHLGPLSLAETRRLIYRLPALAGGEPQFVSLALRQIGGHPRTLEYLDAILRHDAARLPQISVRLRKQARALGLDPDELGGDPESALQDALRIAAADVLLDQLLEIVGQKAGDLDALHQAAVFATPVTIEELAFALAGAQTPSAAQVRAAGQAARRLAESSLLTPLPDHQVWVHRWTAQSLRQRSAQADFLERCRRAGETLMWRVATVSHSLGDAVEAVRRFLEGEAFDRATEIAWEIIELLGTYGQTVELAAFLAEIVAALPSEHPSYPGLCGYLR